jgi:hypothetical protein
MTNISGKGIAKFKEKLDKEFLKLDLEEEAKECIWRLIEMELKYPTTDRDVIHRYGGIIEDARRDK